MNYIEVKDLKLADHIHEYLSINAEQLGLELTEYIRGILGRHFVSAPSLKPQQPMFVVPMRSGPTDEDIRHAAKITAQEAMKAQLMVQAAAGGLNCSNCTLKISTADLEKGECGSCHTPIKGLE